MSAPQPPHDGTTSACALDAFECTSDSNRRDTMPWQKEFRLPYAKKGMHLVTREVVAACEAGLRGVDIGIFTLHCMHTSAGLTVNENCDPSVRHDMDMALDRIVPESLPWQHTDEGPDDSVSHLKTSLVGNSITLPIRDGRLVLGTWQGIYLAEFRYSGSGWGGGGEGRKVVATILP